MPWLLNHLRVLAALLGAFLLGLGAAAWLHRGTPGLVRLGVILVCVLLLSIAGGLLLRWIVIPFHGSGRAPVSLEDLPHLWAELERENLTLRELTEAEDALRRGILARLQEGLILLGPEGTVRLYNPAAEALLGRGAALVRGASAGILFREPESRRHLEAAQAGGTVEWSLKRGNRTLRLRGLPFGSGAGGSLLLTLDDVTRQEALETTRQRFVSNLGHELKTPLTSLRIASENLLAEKTRDGREDPNVAMLLRAVERMALLLDDISELSRIESGALRLAPGPVPVEGFLQELLGEFEPQAKAKGLRLTARVTGDPASVMTVDGLRLHQLLGNILGNAIKFSPEGGPVEVGLRLEADRMRWEVRDEGPGISLADQPKVFERFFRAATVRAIPGTGLGLAIVKHLARLMGGEVGFQSEPGRGATFWVDLPREHPGADATVA